jgi:hypothetical protein
LKLLWGNIRKILKDTGIGNGFLNTNLLAQEIRVRIDNWNCIKLKSNCTSKETIIRMKRQKTE